VSYPLLHSKTNDSNLLIIIQEVEIPRRMLILALDLVVEIV